MAKKEEMTMALVPMGGMELALPEDLRAELAQDAKETASTERPAIGRIGLKAGIITYEGEPVKGNKLRVVVLAKSYLNVFYAGAFDENNPSAPACFALCDNEADLDYMKPHPEVAKPVHETCDGCPNMKWKSAGNGRKGKACKETRRLVLMPEGALESPEDVQTAELASMRLPLTSVSVWGTFVNALDATVKLPHYAVVCELGTEPDLKTQFKLTMTPVARIASPEVLRAVMAKREEARRIAMLPFGSGEDMEGDPDGGQGSNVEPLKNEKF
jgi:hypothetical protein